jgi:magnesium transporter
MRRRLTPKSNIGLPPGELVYVGEKTDQEILLTRFAYSPDGDVQEDTGVSLEKYLDFKNKPGVTWLNIDGIHNVSLIEAVGNYIDLHTLVSEDILDTNQRPKMDDYDDYIFFVLKMIYWGEAESEIEVEQVSMVLGRSFVITFQEEPERDIFDPIRQRIREKKGRLVKMGADFLAYSLIDLVIDNYFIILERMGEQIEFLEEKLVKDPATETLQTIYKLKRELIVLRRAIWPMRELIAGLERSGTDLIEAGTFTFLRDAYDHAIQVIETVETFRDSVSGMLDIYLSSVSNRLNEVMKVLTIISTIFIPLTFIAGVYGMNFRFMPGLQWRLGYFVVMAVMGIIVIMMIFYFRRKGWIS